MTVLSVLGVLCFVIVYSDSTSVGIGISRDRLVTECPCNEILRYLVWLV